MSECDSDISNVDIFCVRLSPYVDSFCVRLSPYQNNVDSFSVRLSPYQKYL